jgi:hypothetical protein
MRILISYEESYRVYSDALERAIRGLRPDTDVAACSLAEIGEQVEQTSPLIARRMRAAKLAVKSDAVA